MGRRTIVGKNNAEYVQNAWRYCLSNIARMYECMNVCVYLKYTKMCYNTRIPAKEILPYKRISFISCQKKGDIQI